MLMDTLLIPRLILPYLDRCVMHLHVLYQERRVLDGEGEGEDDAEGEVEGGADDARRRFRDSEQDLAKGIAASLRTLVHPPISRFP